MTRRVGSWLGPLLLGVLLTCGLWAFFTDPAIRVVREPHSSSFEEDTSKAPIVSTLPGEDSRRAEWRGTRDRPHTALRDTFDQAKAESRARKRRARELRSGGKVHGKVQDRRGNPITIANVRDRGGKMLARTDWSGTFVIHVPASGQMEVGAPGYVPELVAVGNPGKVLVVLDRARVLLGSVLAKETFLPLAKARIRVESVSRRYTRATDDFGRYSLSLPDEEVQLHVSFKERVTKIWRDGDSPIIELERGREIKGKVVMVQKDGDRRAAPADVGLVVIGSTQPFTPHGEKTVGIEGRFHLKGGIHPKEEFLVLAFSVRYATPLDSKWHPPKTEEPEVEMHERGTAVLLGAEEGSILPLPMDPPAGLNPNSVRPQEAKAGRLLTFDGLAAGRYHFHKDGKSVGKSFQIVPAKTTTVSWKKKPVRSKKTGKRGGEREELTGPPRTIQVRVRGPRRRPLAGVTVLVSQKKTKKTARSDEAGVVSFSDLRGDWTFSASKKGLLLSEVVRRRARDHRDVVLLLAPPQTLRGRVTPPEKVAIRLLDDTGAVRARTETDAETGRFELKDLEPRRYQLEVQSAERIILGGQVALPLEQDLVLDISPAR